MHLIVPLAVQYLYNALVKKILCVDHYRNVTGNTQNVYKMITIPKLHHKYIYYEKGWQWH